VKYEKRQSKDSERGFTLVELLVGSAVMLVIVLGALAIYSKSNRVSVNEQMFSEVQSSVRSAMFFICRDLRMAGVGIPPEFSAHILEGKDNEDQGSEVAPDRLTLMGNIDDFMVMRIQDYQGSAAVLSVDDFSFEQYHYPDAFYADKLALILPNRDSGCPSGQIRRITHVTHAEGGTNEKFNFSPGLAPGVNPPGGLSGFCPDSDDYDGGSICFVNVKEFWLDTTGNQSGLAAGENGYIGGGQKGILYMTLNSHHTPLADKIENLQFEYCGDFDEDGVLDGWFPWDNAWTPEMIGRINQVRIWLLGRTPQSSHSSAQKVPGDIHIYRRPQVSNSSAADANDGHKRFLLESGSAIRNTNLNIYNVGQR